jgi:dihydroorotase-like cyclic amidohydrolase
VQRSHDIDQLRASLQQTSKQQLIVDAGSYVVMPGLVDNHIHINEPGNSTLNSFSFQSKEKTKGVVIVFFFDGRDFSGMGRF